MSLSTGTLWMGQYTRGDVVIAPVAIDERNAVKTRPAVIIGTGRQGEVYLCPISSKPSSDAPCIPISLDHFSKGGLDLFHESYILMSRVCRIRCCEIIGNKGRLTEETTASLPIPQEKRHDCSGTKKGSMKRK
jgi:mRNA interferase MazF